MQRPHDRGRPGYSKGQCRVGPGDRLYPGRNVFPAGRVEPEGVVDFSGVVTFNLDEYAASPYASPELPLLYAPALFDHVNVRPQNIHIPAGDAADSGAFCREYDQAIAAAGGIDLQILGIGVNGHIGFNEPGSCLNVGTHVVDLTAETIAANSRFFASPDEVPRQAVTMGMGSIMRAKGFAIGRREKRPRPLKKR